MPPVSAPTWPPDPALYGLVKWHQWVCWRRDGTHWTAQGGADEYKAAQYLAQAAGCSRILPRGERPR
jgi:hypothetical protein